MNGSRPVTGRVVHAATLAAIALLALPGAPARAQERAGANPVAPALPLPGATARPALRAPALSAVPAAATRPAPVPVQLLLEAGAGRLLQMPAAALTVMAADPRIARVQPASPTSIFVMAVGPGRTTIVATAEDGMQIAEYDVTVTPNRAAAAAAVAATPPTGGGEGRPAEPPLNPAAIQAQIRRLVPGTEGVQVIAAGRNALVLSGMVANAADAHRAEAIARAHAGAEREVLNQLGLLSSIQVNVRVRVAEISRQVTRELGFNWQALGTDASNWLIGLRTGAAGAVLGALTGVSNNVDGAPGRIGLGYRSSRFDINGVVDALAADQLITILAEPNLTAQSGEVASFLAGGEFPVPVAASAQNNAISIEFKQFGVSLAFVPTVLSPERLNLRIRPEVSELSDNGAISLPLASGVVRIPALTVRRAETTVELGSGQSFAIAGLLQRGSTLADSGVNGLSDVPVVGALFRSDRFRRNESELVIIVTPYLVRPVSDPRALAAPTDRLRHATDLDRVLYRRQVARGVDRPVPRTSLDVGFIVE